MKTPWVMASALLISATAIAQDWVESRFDRVHLRNGNFVDGTILRESPRELTLSFQGGQISIRKNQIDRIEVIRIRSLREKPKERPIEPVAPAAPIKKKENVVKAPGASPTGPDRAPLALTGTVADLLDKLESSIPSERGALLDALVANGKGAGEAIARWMGFLDAERRTVAAGALSRLKAAEAVPTLISYVTDSKDASLRADSVGVLAMIGGRLARNTIRKATRDPDASVRVAAARGTQAMNDPESFGTACALVRDESPEVREAALEAAEALANTHGLGTELATQLGRIVASAKPPAAVEILKTLGRSGGPAAARVAVDSLDHRDATVRAAAAGALSQAAAPESAPEILARMGRERDNEVRVFLARAAGAVRLTDGIDLLIQWVGDEDIAVRGAAARALTKITNQRFGRNQDHWLTWWDRARPRGGN